MNEIDVEQLDDENEQRKDLRRANGAPLVSDPENPDKTLRYRRPSGYAKNLDDENALVEWRIWKAMSGVARSRALAAKISSTKDEDKKARKALRDEAMDKGAANESSDMGTALHAMTARVEDPNDDFDPPDQYVMDLDAYVAALASYGLSSRHVEVVMVNDEFRAAGTADRIFELTKPLTPPKGDTIPAGTLVLGDLKTGKSLDFAAPGFNVQTALYATGQFYDIVTERRMPTPPIDPNWTILVHLPVGKGSCTLHWCSIEVGLWGAYLASEVKAWQNKWKNGTHDTPRVAVPETAAEIIAAVGIEAEEVMTADLVPTMVAFCKLRIARIRDIEAARADLTAAWPLRLPKPNDISQAIEVVWLLDLLDKVEAKYSLPFIADPRRTMQSGHKRAVDRSNEFALVND